MRGNPDHDYFAYVVAIRNAGTIAEVVPYITVARRMQLATDLEVIHGPVELPATPS